MPEFKEIDKDLVTTAYTNFKQLHNKEIERLSNLGITTPSSMGIHRIIKAKAKTKQEAKDKPPPNRGP
jgi:hypothetical protein